MYAIIASGPNRIRIPVVICLTENDAEELLASCGERVSRLKVGGIVADPAGEYLTTEIHGQLGPGQPHLIDLDDEQTCTKLLRDYYGGCGGIGRFDIVEITPGVPIVGWDLD